MMDGRACARSPVVIVGVNPACLQSRRPRPSEREVQSNRTQEVSRQRSGFPASRQEPQGLPFSRTRRRALKVPVSRAATPPTVLRTEPPSWRQVAAFVGWKEPSATGRPPGRLAEGPGDGYFQCPAL